MANSYVSSATVRVIWSRFIREWPPKIVIVLAPEPRRSTKKNLLFHLAATNTIRDSDKRLCGMRNSRKKTESGNAGSGPLPLPLPFQTLIDLLLGFALTLRGWRLHTKNSLHKARHHWKVSQLSLTHRQMHAPVK